MDRRSFLQSIRQHISGSFVLGSTGGAFVGAVGMRKYDRDQGTFGTPSFAQQGEDVVLWKMFQQSLQIPKPTYLDIGAYDPVWNSNTFLFYRNGCRGTLVEPNPAQWPRLESVRPEDRLVRAGIGLTAETETDYYVIGGPGGGVLNTFSREEAESYAEKTGGVHTIEKVIKMPLLDINDLMQEQFQAAPNLISIDTEGLDYDILKSVDFDRFRPEAFCVETKDFGSDRLRSEILELMDAKEYVVRGGSFLNTIFVDGRKIKV